MAGAVHPAADGTAGYLPERIPVIGLSISADRDTGVQVVLEDVLTGGLRTTVARPAQAVPGRFSLGIDMIEEPAIGHVLAVSARNFR